MALILFNPAPRSGKGDRLLGGGRAWAATPAAWLQAPSTMLRMVLLPRANARGRINEIVLATRLRARALPTTKPINSPPAPRGRRSAERRMPTMCRAASTNVAVCRPGCAARRQVYAVCALICSRLRAISGRARLPALRPRLSQGLPSLLSSRPCFLGLGIKRALPASILSQSSDSTSRLGRSTEGNDARSRSGAGCEPARKHRTRSTLQIASGMRPSMSEIVQTCI